MEALHTVVHLGNVGVIGLHIARQTHEISDFGHLIPVVDAQHAQGHISAQSQLVKATAPAIGELARAFWREANPQQLIVFLCTLSDSTISPTTPLGDERSIGTAPMKRIQRPNNGMRKRLSLAKNCTGKPTAHLTGIMVMKSQLLVWG
jgi:hypothetical protein